VIMLLMTESRGAYAGAIIGYGCAIYSFRRYLTPRIIMLWVTTGAVFLVLGALLAGSQFVTALADRIFGQGGAADIGEISSGRSDIWAAALGRMMSAPVTLVTGFGWDAYSIMGFFYAAHNHYLGLYFELGLVGLVSFILLAYQILKVARAAVEAKSPDATPYLMAFVFGFGGLLVCIFFSQLYGPWLYIWAYAGVSLRMALSAAAKSGKASVIETKQALKGHHVRRSVAGRNVA
jgi:O-antigen ligase